MNRRDSFLMTNRFHELVVRWMAGSRRGRAFGGWFAGMIAQPQLQRMVLETVPWSPLPRPLREATVAIVTTSGTHLASDPPFELFSDATFRVIPRTAQPANLTITHIAYDRADALSDINLVFPLQRLRELEAEGVIGQVADRHYSFGLCQQGELLVEPGREVARLMKQDGVDLALLVPA